MSAGRPETAQPAHTALSVVRRLIVFLLLFALVLIGASGLSGLLERLLSTGAPLAERDVGGLARSLAFAVIGGSLAAVLWLLVWRRLRSPEERSSLAWGLYVAGVYTVALVTWTTALLGLAASLIGGAARLWDSAAATALVWVLVWGWHRWMWRHPVKGPSRLAGVPTVLGSVFGLLIGTGGAVTALGGILDTGLQGFAGTQSVGQPWWVPIAQALVWAAGGAAVWWWHWIRGRGRRLRSGLANVALAVVGLLGGCILALSGTITALFVLLRLAFDRSDTLGQIFEPLGPAVAAAAVGALVWRYHSVLASHRSGSMRRASRLLASGAALVAAASGIGVIVNAALGLAETTLAGTGTRTLLLGGISALAVGGPVWWNVWDPFHRQDAGQAEHGQPERGHPEHGKAESGKQQSGRRIYLVVVFGISAVVALMTLLVIGYQVFEHLLDSSGRGSLVGRVRAPLGLLVATALVAAYHYGAWRRDRSVQPPADTGQDTGRELPAGGPAAGRGIGHVILVTGFDPVPWVRVIRDVTGTEATVWRRADTGGTAVGPLDAAETGAAETASGRLAGALNGVSGEYVLVVVGRDAEIDVIPLEAGLTPEPARPGTA